MEKVNICYICDNNYVMPTMVSMNSLIASKDKDTVYNIFVICADLTDDNLKNIKKLETENVDITIIGQDISFFNTLHKYDEKSNCVATPAALLKFIIPDLLSEIDRIVYLDGDLIVLEDLSTIYNIDLEDNYLAAVEDSGTIYVKNAVINSVENYFNSGVMILNLKAMRENGLPEKLIKLKSESQDYSLMDQNVFNIVCDKRIKLLPIRYNFLPINLLRAFDSWSVDDINNKYNTDYKTVDKLFSDAAIVHFSSKDKPWKSEDVIFSDLWYRFYLMTPIEHQIKRSYEQDNLKTTYVKGQLYQKLYSKALGQVNICNSKLLQKDVLIDDYENRLLLKDEHIAAKDKLLAENKEKLIARDETINIYKQRISEKDRRIADKDKLLEESKEKLVARDEIIADYKQRISEKDRRIADKDKLLEESKEKLAARDETIVGYKQRISEKNRRIEEKGRLLTEKKSRIELLLNDINGYQKKTDQLNKTVYDLENKCRKQEDTICSIQNSASYKIGRFITWLPRKIRDILK